jgi:tetratricopeptide (TPR) repeat protein
MVMTLGTARGLVGGLVLALATTAALADKDIGPGNATCDGMSKSGAQWKACAEQVAASQHDAELFYAGYWLAKGGHYHEALGFLRQAKAPDERILTYIGFATRKLGDVDGAMRFYNQALDMNPDYSVARAYMGEGFLTRGEPDKAAQQLTEIERRCGRSCAEYADLATQIAHYRTGRQG